MYMGEHQDKHKEKIRQLLELSMSDNPNEAETALRHAMALMNKHNITKDEVYGQKLIQRGIITRFKRIPDWCLNLHSGIADVFATHSSYCMPGPAWLAYVLFTGRERDVENAIYIFEYVRRALEIKAAKFKKALRLQGHANSGLAQKVKSYRAGFSERIYERLKETRQHFLTEQSSSSNSLVCVDDETRKDEAWAYFMKLNPTATMRLI